MITLYHNTTYRNALSILKSGLEVSYSKSELASGWQMTWASTHPVPGGAWGGNIVKFFVTDNDDYEQVNSEQYIVYNDIPVEQIIGVDFMLGSDDMYAMHLSEVQEYIDEYGVDAVREVLYKYHNKDIPLEDLKELTPMLHWEDDNIKLEQLHRANNYYAGRRNRSSHTYTTSRRTRLNFR